jgi:hypothetical protein
MIGEEEEQIGEEEQMREEARREGMVERGGDQGTEDRRKEAA